MPDPSTVELSERITADELGMILEMMDYIDPENLKPSEVKSLLAFLTPIYLRVLATTPPARKLSVVG